MIINTESAWKGETHTKIKISNLQYIIINIQARENVNLKMNK